MTPTDAQIEMGAGGLGVCICERHGPYGSPCPRDGTTKDKARAVLTPVLSDIEEKILARCMTEKHRNRIATPSKWEVCAQCRPYLAIVRGEQP